MAVSGEEGTARSVRPARPKALAPLPPSCSFCAIIDGQAPATVVRRWRDAIAIVPLNPVTEGHVLIIPTWHVVDATEEPQVTADVMRCAAEYAQRPCNIITSAGSEATQTVFHLHVHVVPRSEDDGLALPWTAQRRGVCGAGGCTNPPPKPEDYASCFYDGSPCYTGDVSGREGQQQ